MDFEGSSFYQPDMSGNVTKTITICDVSIPVTLYDYLSITVYPIDFLSDFYNEYDFSQLDVRFGRKFDPMDGRDMVALFECYEREAYKRPSIEYTAWRGIASQFRNFATPAFHTEEIQYGSTEHEYFSVAGTVELSPFDIVATPTIVSGKYVKVKTDDDAFIQMVKANHLGVMVDKDRHECIISGVGKPNDFKKLFKYLRLLRIKVPYTEFNIDRIICLNDSEHAQEGNPREIEVHEPDKKVHAIKVLKSVVNNLLDEEERQIGDDICVIRFSDVLRSHQYPQEKVDREKVVRLAPRSATVGELYEELGRYRRRRKLIFGRRPFRRHAEYLASLLLGQESEVIIHNEGKPPGETFAAIAAVLCEAPILFGKELVARSSLFSFDGLRVHVHRQ